MWILFLIEMIQILVLQLRKTYFKEIAMLISNIMLL